MMVESSESTPAGRVFDRLAAQYDAIFTFSTIGRSQRDVAWDHALAAFTPGNHILELNCGTGEDALFLAKAGMRVTGYDASVGMIVQARNKVAAEGLGAQVDFHVLPTEEIASLPQTQQFDGLFSNFSGLNCVQDLRSVARQIATRLRPGAPLLLCLSTRYCLWEIVYYMLRGNPGKALRRCKGSTQARVGDLVFPVYYPTISELCSAFGPGYRLVSTAGIGITVPPSYLESWILQHPRLLCLLKKIDNIVRTWPVVRTLGDHMLLHMERV
jgi:ubiquinone/menaquinone biosynthesis C-methylase UbiE